MTVEAFIAFLAATYLHAAGVPLSGVALVAIGLATLLLLLLIRTQRRLRALRADLGIDLSGEGRIEALLRSQAEMAGRLQSMTDIMGSRQAEMTRTLADRFDGLSSRIGQSLASTTDQTHSSLSALGERLAIIDRAQSRIADLAGDIGRLQDILDNKQTRGAFGEARMQAIVADALPPSAYRFQAQLSNGKRPDCLVLMPNKAPPLAIDAKFPLEAYSALKDAETKDAEDFALAKLRRDMDVHIRAIASKYLIPGETQDTAFMFVPSESVYAELGERLPDILQRAYRARVVIVSPSLLMLSIQLVQNLLKDARMRQEAGRIQTEVRHLAEELARLDERVGALKTHFTRTGRDVDEILTATRKVMQRADRIETLPFQDEGASGPRPAAYTSS